MRDIVVQYVADCANVSVVLERLSRAGADLSAVRMVEVGADGRVPTGFAGSPTVLIDGVNPVGSDGEEFVGASCSLRIPTLDRLLEVLSGP